MEAIHNRPRAISLQFRAARPAKRNLSESVSSCIDNADRQLARRHKREAPAGGAVSDYHEVGERPRIANDRELDARYCDIAGHKRTVNTHIVCSSLRFAHSCVRNYADQRLAAKEVYSIGQFAVCVFRCRSNIRRACSDLWRAFDITRQHQVNSSALAV
jgi:hypothetical protein